MRKVLIVLALVTFILAIGAYGVAHGWFGRHYDAGVMTGTAVPDAVVAERSERQLATAHRLNRAPGLAEAESTGPVDSQPKQILFGDLHVHSTYSLDAFSLSLPMLQGEGAHPLADACDFARFCSALDFWSINDHAEGLTPLQWRETVDSIRQCNAVAGDSANPDVVAFLGWEWSQVGPVPEEHYGHKNVILAHTDDDKIPARPIASAGLARQALIGIPPRSRLGLALIGRQQPYLDYARFIAERSAVPLCPEGVDVRDLPLDCAETAETPGDLFAKLDQWGHDALVIPHGTTWGFYSPPGSSWDKQLTAAQHDPDRQTLVEVYSGHGNSEEYRDWRAIRWDDEGQPHCVEPSDGYTPGCWRAGEIIRSRCLESGESETECESRAVTARHDYAMVGVAGHLSVPGATVPDWLDSGQCTDCFQPSFTYRPASSVQYMLALRNFDMGNSDEPAGPDRFRFGFIASSDIHKSRPGTGYKEYDRQEMTEAGGGVDLQARKLFGPPITEPQPRSVSFDPFSNDIQIFRRLETERQASFFYTGGLVAVHSSGRDRGSIWSALQNKEVYGTSGGRMLLWFDLLNGPEGEMAMGSETSMGEAPRFRVRAAGSFVQKSGCPKESTEALGAERLYDLCRNECYNPSDERKRVTRIEVVRIRPQIRPDEPVGELIEDPWLVLPCAGEGEGCVAEFEDPEHVSGGRDSVYYVRAIEEPSPAVNGDPIRCTYDENGKCVDTNPCYGDYKTEYQDDCLSDVEERAWSSPIYVDFSDIR